MPSHKELLAAIPETAAAISEQTVQGVFEHWRKRREWVSQNNNDCYPETQHYGIQFSLIPVRD
jgi:hypothetical protein